MNGIAAKTFHLVPECVTNRDSSGPVIDCRSERGELLVLTLGIDSVLQQESIVVSVWGSADALHWGTEPLVRFSEKSYCGLYSILLNLANYPDVQYLRARWTLRRWNKKTGEPRFGFHVYAEPSGSRLSSTVRHPISRSAQAFLRAAS